MNLAAWEGSPYVRGAGGADKSAAEVRELGADCSGGALAVLADHGVIDRTFPRLTAHGMAMRAARVEPAHVAPLDLAFYWRPGRPVHHVAVVVGHDGKTGEPMVLCWSSALGRAHVARASHAREEGMRLCYGSLRA